MGKMRRMLWRSNTVLAVLVPFLTGHGQMHPSWALSRIPHEGMGISVF